MSEQVVGCPPGACAVFEGHFAVNHDPAIAVRVLYAPPLATRKVVHDFGLGGGLIAHLAAVSIGLFGPAHDTTMQAGPVVTYGGCVKENRPAGDFDQLIIESTGRRRVKSRAARRTAANT